MSRLKLLTSILFSALVLTNFSSIRVATAQTGESLVVFPFAKEMEVGEVFQFQASTDPFGCSQVSGCIGMEDVTAEAFWSSDEPDVLKSLGDGRFEAVSPGDAEVSAERGGQSDESRVVVIGRDGSGEDEPTEGMNISLVKKVLELTGINQLKNATAVFVEWIGDYFVITGHRCRISRTDSDGLWVFDRQGNRTGERSVCNDVGAPSIGLHDWGFAMRVHQDTDNGFVVGGQSTGAYRPPLYYQLTSAGQVQYLGQAHPGSGYGDVGVYNFENFAVAGSRLVANVFATVANDPTIDRSVTRVYDLPSFSETADIPYSVAGGVQPIVGIGKFILAYKQNPAGSSIVYQSPPKVFIPTSDGLEETGQELPNFVGYDISGNRIVVNLSNSSLIEIYETGTDELEKVGSWTIPSGSQPPLVSSFYSALAIQGPYLALGGVCKPGARVGITGGANEGECGFEVWNWQTDELVAKTQVPDGLVVGIDMSPDGYVAVTTLSAGTSEAYIYKVGEISESPITPSTPFTPPAPPFSPNFDPSTLIPNQQIELNENFFRSLTGSYTQNVVDSYGFSSANNSIVPKSNPSNYTLSRPPETVAEIRQFQCAYGIVCSGSIETTGYGNLGPKTQAKIQIVFGDSGSNNGSTY